MGSLATNWGNENQKVTDSRLFHLLLTCQLIFEDKIFKCNIDTLRIKNDLLKIFKQYFKDELQNELNLMLIIIKSGLKFDSLSIYTGMKMN